MSLITTGSSIQRYDLSLRREDWDQLGNEQNYIGLQVMPAAPVAKPASGFTRIPISSLMTPVKDLTRNPRAGYKRDEFGWLSDTYTTQEHGFEGLVDDAEIEMYGDFIPAEQLTVQRVGTELMAEHEQAVATATFNSAAYTGNQLINLTVGSRCQV